MSQTVNLDTKYSKKIDQALTIASLLKGRLSAENEFVGARTVRIHNINTVPLNDYNRGASANRYGEPAEVGDTVQELTMTQDKSFSGVIDKGNNMDQSINKAGKFLGVEMSEEVIPAYDKYCFGRLCTLAGKIMGSADAVSGTQVDAGQKGAAEGPHLVCAQRRIHRAGGMRPIQEPGKAGNEGRGTGPGG